jgi:hypothetical protein
MSYGKLFSDLKVRFRAMAKKPAAPKTSGSAPEPQPLSAADRDLMINMLAGITAQVGWQFGDVYDLVVTVKLADLARNDFTRPIVQITN